jgi:hypothetical protein
MRRTILLLGLLVLTGTSAQAVPRVPNESHLSSMPQYQYPGAPRPVYDDPAPPPYARNYVDDVARALGVKDGRMDVFSTQPESSSGYMPSFSGGLGGDGAMLRLKWHPGE